MTCPRLNAAGATRREHALGLAEGKTTLVNVQTQTADVVRKAEPDFARSTSSILRSKVGCVGGDVAAGTISGH